MEAGRSELQSYPQLHSEFKASLGYMRSCLREKKTKTKTKAKKKKKSRGEGVNMAQGLQTLDSYGIKSLVGMILLASL